MTQAALKAGRGLLRDFNEVEQLQVSQKGPGHFTSNADLRAEKTIYYELMKGRPQYGYLMEESGEIAGENPEYRWIVDPLDGTNNFLHGMPHWAISIALEKQGEIIAGVIYDPLRNEIFCAEKGSGAYMNDRRLRVSARRHLTESLVGISASSHASHKKEAYIQCVNTLLHEKIMHRAMGSASLNLAYLAAGRLDALWEPSLELWDAAAGLLLIQEAGGRLASPSLAEKNAWPGEILAATPHMYEAFEALVRDINP